jgi:hypothetical protein
MDGEMFVPIATIANFGKLRALTTDVELITDVVSSSTNVQLDQAKTKIKPNVKQSRNTVILREMPSNTTSEVSDPNLKNSILIISVCIHQFILYCRMFNQFFRRAIFLLPTLEATLEIVGSHLLRQKTLL